MSLQLGHNSSNAQQRGTTLALSVNTGWSFQTQQTWGVWVSTTQRLGTCPNHFPGARKGWEPGSGTCWESVTGTRAQRLGFPRITRVAKITALLQTARGFTHPNIDSQHTILTDPPAGTTWSSAFSFIFYFLAANSDSIWYGLHIVVRLYLMS